MAAMPESITVRLDLLTVKRCRLFHRWGKWEHVINSFTSGWYPIDQRDRVELMRIHECRRCGHQEAFWVADLTSVKEVTWKNGIVDKEA